MPFYLLNKTETNLVFRGGYVFAKPGVWTPVTAYDVTSQVFKREVDANLVEIKEFETTPEQIAETALVVESQAQGFAEQGLTEDQLKEKLAEKKEAKSSGVTTSLGQSLSQAELEGSLTPPESSPTEQVTEPTPKKKGGKKAHSSPEDTAAPPASEPEVN